MSDVVTDLGLAVYLGFGSDPTTAVGSVVWTNMLTLERMKRVEITRGTAAWPAPFDPGSCVATLRNSDGELDPDNGASAFAGDMLPGVPVKAEMTTSAAATEELYVGYVRPEAGYELTYYDGRSDFIAHAVDRQLFYERVGYFGDITGLSGTAKTFLDAAFADTASGDFDVDKAFDTGVAQLEAAAPFIWTGTLAGFIDRVVMSDGGMFFIARDGTATFLDRHAIANTTETSTSQLDFTDALATTDVDFLNDPPLRKSFGDRIAMGARVTDVNGDQVVETIAGGFAWTANHYDIPETFLTGEVEAEALAQWWATLLSVVDAHPAELSIDPFVSDACRDAVATLDLGHRVTVKFTPPGLSEQTHVCQIVGITHSIGADDWTTTYQMIAGAFFDATDFENWMHWDVDNWDGDSVWAF